MTQISDASRYPYMTKHPLVGPWSRSTLFTVWLAPNVGIYPSHNSLAWLPILCKEEDYNQFVEQPCDREEMLRCLSGQLKLVPDSCKVWPDYLRKQVEAYRDQSER